MSEQQKIELLHEKPSRLLVETQKLNSGYSNEKAYGSKLQEKADTTYSHTVRVLERLEEDGYLEKEENGRKKEIHLTEKGEEAATKIRELQSIRNGGQKV